MSATTLDTEISMDSDTSTAREISRSDAARFRIGAPSVKSDSMLWGFDELAERSRFDRIQSRLIRLEAAVFEEFGSRLNHESRECLLRLFVSCPTVRAPSISSQPDGVLLATWRSAGGDELVVKCVSRTILHFAMVSRSLTNPQLLDRQWGTSHSPSLFLKVNPLARRIAE